jgi:hypothetical protein
MTEKKPIVKVHRNLEVVEVILPCGCIEQYKLVKTSMCEQHGKDSIDGLVALFG